MPFDTKTFGHVLMEFTSLTAQQVDHALEIQRERGGRIGDILLSMKVVTEEEICLALSRQLAIPYHPEIPEVDLDTLRQVPINFCKRHTLMPLRKEGDAVQVALSDPLNISALDDLQLLLKQCVQPILATPSTILQAINRSYDLISDTAQTMVKDMSDDDLGILATDLEEPEDLLDATDDEAPIIRLVNSVMYQSVKQRASDIHIEPYERDLVFRFRIDGVLHDVLRPPKQFQSSIISRVKIMAALNIAEKRLPQDGRIRIKIAGKDIDIRVSVVPTAHGERIVMRLLDRSQVLLPLTNIGMGGDKLRNMRKLITTPHGILLETGPTGSGKTTTLYAALNEINTPEKNIITVEDPIEYQLEGIGQIQVNPKIDLTFARGLRSILRQDPDVIMVGEIRDLETAEIAIQASLTGHLVLSTLHTNDAPTAVTRLVDMGIEPFLVSSSLIGVLAQRLVRLLCPHCREPYVPSDEELQELQIGRSDIPPTGLFRPKGCQRCTDTGYQGRTGIYELLIVDDALQNIILKGGDANVIRKVAMKGGMTTLRKDGADKVLRGITSVQEVARVTQEIVV